MDASGSMWRSRFPDNHQTVTDGLAVLLQAPLACSLTLVRSSHIDAKEKLGHLTLLVLEKAPAKL